VENEFEKIDRLMELYLRYSDRVRSEAERLDQLELDDLELDEDEKYNRKLESGLYSLQVRLSLIYPVSCPFGKWQMCLICVYILHYTLIQASTLDFIFFF
jgi:hypothetical protein